ncbi:MAG: hypothetical protein KC592_04710 [Nitrospira sp.]|nr:hypothetical protein [Nitrospira sp.]
MPNQRPESVLFHVRQNERTFFILSMKYKSDIFEIKDFRVEPGMLFFTWRPGTVDAHCALRQEQNQAFVGGCRFPNSEVSLGLTLFPQIPQENLAGSGE